mgnify:CR=1 FL=1
MDLLISIFGLLFGLFLFIGLLGCIFAILSIIIAFARGQSFSFLLPFGFISSRPGKRR